MLKKLRMICLFLTLKARGCDIEIGSGSYIAWGARVIVGNGRIVIGKNSYIGPDVVLNAYDGAIEIGDNVSVNYYSVLYGHGGLIIGNDTRIAAQSVIIPSEHEFMDKSRLVRKQGSKSMGVRIGQDVWIGASCCILDGSIIEDGCVLGAGTITKGTLEAYGVYVGAPARLIKHRGSA